MTTQLDSMRSAGLRRERVLASAHFKEGVFHNDLPVGPGLKGSPWPLLGEYFSNDVRRSPPGPLPLESPLGAWGTAPDSGMRATWLGHSTVLLELDGARILTDPVWGPRASFSTLVGPKRFAPVPVELAQLPQLDAVIISHDHYDHLDYPTIRALAGSEVPFYTSLGVGAHLQAWGIPPHRIFELDWWEQAVLRGGDLVITAAPSQHFSGRGVLDRNKTFWSSFAVRTPHHSAFFSGDTGLTNAYEVIGTRLGPFDLIMLEIGAWHEAWGDIHLGPQAALKAFHMLAAGAPQSSFLPVHWGTFNLALHAWNEPAETLVRLASQDETRLLMPRLGAAVQPTQTELVDTWWRDIPVVTRGWSGWRRSTSSAGSQ